jgi:hypothetical protein
MPGADAFGGGASTIYPGNEEDMVRDEVPHALNWLGGSGARGGEPVATNR